MSHNAFEPSLQKNMDQNHQKGQGSSRHCSLPSQNPVTARPVSQVMSRSTKVRLVHKFHVPQTIPEEPQSSGFSTTLRSIMYRTFSEVEDRWLLNILIMFSIKKTKQNRKINKKNKIGGVFHKFEIFLAQLRSSSLVLAGTGTSLIFG